MSYFTHCHTFLYFSTCVCDRTHKLFMQLAAARSKFTPKNKNRFSFIFLNFKNFADVVTYTSQTHNLHVRVKSAALDGSCISPVWLFILQPPRKNFLLVSLQRHVNFLLSLWKLSRPNAAVLHRTLFRVSSCGLGYIVLAPVSVSYMLTWDLSHWGRVSLFYLPPHLQLVSPFSEIFVHCFLLWYESRSWRTPSPSRVPQR